MWFVHRAILKRDEPGTRGDWRGITVRCGAFHESAIESTYFPVDQHKICIYS